ncbi:aspartate/glutamate racemase family protein [Aquipuribacter nitratireducens]|uniref:Aspartate/glutamate racemase family protein n=1 Tax=Aquipuribacter nitratireducens TaxID=650104 RepID=A0ABW0GQZ7_9MICO
MTRRLVGVVGGVGPLATAYFLDRVVRLTDAATDQEHVDLVVHQRASIPDRTAFLLGRSDADPGPVMAACARELVQLGAEAVVLPCNTAEPFLPVVQAEAGVEVVGIVRATVAEAVGTVPGLDRVGVLATDGTLAARTYHDELARVGAEAVVPDPADQAVVMRVIYEQVKAGREVDVAALAAVADRLAARGAQCVVLGCTELSVVAASTTALTVATVVDSVEALARATIRLAGAPVAAP